MNILVGSLNPVKIDAVKISFSTYFPDITVSGIEVFSNVAGQPVNSDTFLGAQNRAKALQKIDTEQNLKARFFVGIEGGIQEIFSKWFALGCMCIMDREGKIGFGTSPQFELPMVIVERLLNGEELGDVIDDLTGLKNTKQKQGAIGYLTQGVLDRKNIYVQGLHMALIPFLNPGLFNSK